VNVLQSLSKKLTYVAENKESTKDSLAMQDVIPEFERLRVKAVYKVLSLQDCFFGSIYCMTARGCNVSNFRRSSIFSRLPQH
jgi:hypothetical protein